MIDLNDDKYKTMRGMKFKVVKLLLQQTVAKYFGISEEYNWFLPLVTNYFFSILMNIVYYMNTVFIIAAFLTEGFKGRLRSLFALPNNNDKRRIPSF